VELEFGKPGPGGAVQPAGRLTPYDLYGEAAQGLAQPAVRALPAARRHGRGAGGRRGPVPDAGRLDRADPARVPELRSLQEYIGSTQPVLMDWAVGLAFPCQQPMLHVNGVTEVPRFRITPGLQREEAGHRHLAGRRERRPTGYHPTCYLLRAHVMATYLSHDWARDWGSLRKFDTPWSTLRPPRLDLGTATPTSAGGRRARSGSSRSSRSTSEGSLASSVTEERRVYLFDSSARRYHWVRIHRIDSAYPSI